MERSVPKESHQGTVSAVMETRSIKRILSLRANEQRIISCICRQLDSFVGIIHYLGVVSQRSSLKLGAVSNHHVWLLPATEINSPKRISRDDFTWYEEVLLS